MIAQELVKWLGRPFRCQAFTKFTKSGRRRTGDCDLPAVAGVAETQFAGVQEVAGVSRHRACAEDEPASRRVERVADQGMPGRGQVDADLMRPPRADAHVAEEGPAAAFEHADEALRGLAG